MFKTNFWKAGFTVLDNNNKEDGRENILERNKIKTLVSFRERVKVPIKFRLHLTFKSTELNKENKEH